MLERAEVAPRRILARSEHDLAADYLEGLARALRNGAALHAEVTVAIESDGALTGATTYTWSVTLPPRKVAMKAGLRWV